MNQDNTIGKFILLFAFPGVLAMISLLGMVNWKAGDIQIARQPQPVQPVEVEPEPDLEPEEPVIETVFIPQFEAELPDEVDPLSPAGLCWTKGKGGEACLELSWKRQGTTVIDLQTKRRRFFPWELNRK